MDWENLPWQMLCFFPGLLDNQPSHFYEGLTALSSVSFTQMLSADIILIFHIRKLNLRVKCLGHGYTVSIITEWNPAFDSNSSGITSLDFVAKHITLDILNISLS
jgi:hypothetical protein